MTRQHLHARRIAFDGYRRDDGLFEVEAQLHDATAVPTPMPYGDLEAGDTIHDLALTLCFDRALRVHEVRALTARGATPFCAEVNAAYATIAGLTIGPGFKEEVKRRVGGVRGCIHLNELLLGLAQVAMQTWFSVRRQEARQERERDSAAPMKRPFVIDTCHAYREGGEAVDVFWPPKRRATR